MYGVNYKYSNLGARVQKSGVVLARAYSALGTLRAGNRAFKVPSPFKFYLFLLLNT